MWTLANAPRAGKVVREVSQLGAGQGRVHRQRQLAAPALRPRGPADVSDYVMTEHELHAASRVADESVGLAAYGMDSHNTQRYVDATGHARNEGDVQVGGFSPLSDQLSLDRAQGRRCTNLLVPVCLSASHIAYGSIRMEPVFMVLGQSAALPGTTAREARAQASWYAD